MKAQNNKLKISGLVGSLRKDSFNKALMREAKKACPPDAEIEILDIRLPLFNTFEYRIESRKRDRRKKTIKELKNTATDITLSQNELIG